MRSLVSLQSVISLLVICQLAIAIAGWNCWCSIENKMQCDLAKISKGVAIVNLDEVAKQLGMDAELTKQIKNAETSLNGQLKTFQGSLKEQYLQKKQELDQQSVARGTNPENTPDKQELVEFEQKLNLQLRQAQQDARKKFNIYQQQLIQGFRSEIIPVAQKIAAQHGLKVVIAKNDAVLLAFDEAHDITTTVVKTLRKEKAAAEVQQVSQAARSDSEATQLR